MEVVSSKMELYEQIKLLEKQRNQLDDDIDDAYKRYDAMSGEEKTWSKYTVISWVRFRLSSGIMVIGMFIRQNEDFT